MSNPNRRLMIDGIFVPEDTYIKLLEWTVKDDFDTIFDLFHTCHLRKLTSIQFNQLLEVFINKEL